MSEEEKERSILVCGVKDEDKSIGLDGWMMELDFYEKLKWIGEAIDGGFSRVSAAEIRNQDRI